MSRQAHWENVYGSKPDDQLSWTQVEPRVSLELIAAACPSGGRVIDVGGGASPLAGLLAARGYDVAVLDISAAALDRARQPMAPPAAARVRWIVADVTAAVDVGQFDVWHDRAVFHFLTDPADRARYVAMMMRTIVPGGSAVVATFAPDGPSQCSGLDVCRYDGAALAMELGDGFSLLRELRETHITPGGKPQSFLYALFRRVHGVESERA
jgi:SAM-dependent methyltransferase